MARKGKGKRARQQFILAAQREKGGETTGHVFYKWDGSPVEVFDGTPTQIRRWDKFLAKEFEPRVWQRLSAEGLVRDGRLETNGARLDLVLPKIVRVIGVDAIHSPTFRYLLEVATLEVYSIGQARVSRLFRSLGSALGHTLPVRRGRRRKPTAMRGEADLELFRRVEAERNGQGPTATLRRMKYPDGHMRYSEETLPAALQSYKRGKRIATNAGNPTTP